MSRVIKFRVWGPYYDPEAIAAWDKENPYISKYPDMSFHNEWTMKRLYFLAALKRHKMHYPALFGHDSGRSIGWSMDKSGGFDLENGWCFTYEDSSQAEPEVVIQEWSGLTLPNSTDIYEGDILNTKAARWEVVFERGAFVGKWLMGMGDKDTRHILWPMMEHAILLGNRWEHPHLLVDILPQVSDNTTS